MDFRHEFSNQIINRVDSVLNKELWSSDWILTSRLFHTEIFSKEMKLLHALEETLEEMEYDL